MCSCLRQACPYCAEGTTSLCNQKTSFQCVHRSRVAIYWVQALGNSRDVSACTRACSRYSKMNDKPRIAKCRDSESLLITREPSIRKGVSDERHCDYGRS